MSPTSRNIWGSPMLEAQQQQQPKPTPVNNIQSLFDFAKLANAVSSYVVKAKCIK